MDIRKYIELGIPIPIGVSGENNIESFKFGYGDWASLYGDGVLSINHQRPGDTYPYPCTITTEDFIATWEISATDTQYSGQGRIQVVYMVNGTVKKTMIGNTLIESSLGENVGAVDPISSYIDTMVDIKNDTYQYKLEAEASANTASQKAQDVLGLTAEASINNAVGIPSVGVSVTQDGDHKKMSFSFENLKGDPGRDYSEVFVTPEMFGAMGDGTTDDSTAIQSAIDSGAEMIVMIGDYLIASTIKIAGALTLYHRGTITYTGSGSAIKIERVQNSCNITLDKIEATNGNGIEFYASTYASGNANRIQYLNLDFNSIRALDKCIYMNLDVEPGISNTATVGWINEVRISNGRFAAGNYGIYGDAKGYQKMNNIKLFNVAFEGITTGIYMANGCARWSFMNSRYAESYTTLIKTVGSVSEFNFYGAQHREDSVFDFSANTSGIINMPVYDGANIVGMTRVVNKGVIQEQSNDVTRRFTLNSISYSSTNPKTLIEHNILPTNTGIYFVILGTYSLTVSGLVSIYVVSVSSSLVSSVTAIFEGTGAQAPRVASDGTLTKYNSSSTTSIKSMAIKMNS